MKTNIHFGSYFIQFFLEWEMFQTHFVEKMKTRILCSVIPPPISSRLWGYVENYSKAVQARDDNMAHAHFTLGT